MSRPRAYQMIDAAAVVGTLSTIVDKVPATESQARPLTHEKAARPVDQVDGFSPPYTASNEPAALFFAPIFTSARRVHPRQPTVAAAKTG